MLLLAPFGRSAAIRLPVAPQLWNGLSPSKKDKMVDGSTRRPCVFHSPFNRADFRREGTGQVVWRTDLEVDLELNTELLRGVVHPISTPNDYRNTVFDNVISLSGSYRNNALPRSPRESFSLLQLTPCIEKVFPRKKGISYS